MKPHESIKPPRQHRKASTLKTQLPFYSALRTGAALFIGAVLLAGASLMAAEQNDGALLAELKGSKHSLADGIKQSEK